MHREDTFLAQILVTCGKLSACLGWLYGSVYYSRTSGFTYRRQHEADHNWIILRTPKTFT